MNSLLIEKLYIFSATEKKGKVVDFKPGKNIITSSKTNGNRRGKSIILKSIYHSLGADCIFDKKWLEEPKVYITKFFVLENEYYIYRSDRLFKVFSKEFNLLFSTMDRKELSEFFYRLHNFIIELPSRNNDKLVIAPPAYSYVLNFLDQDKIDGSNFKSFDYLTEFSDYKENLLYSHFGVFNKEYYEDVKTKEQISEKIANIQNEKILLDSLMKELEKKIGKHDYSINMTNLEIEVNKTQKEYEEISEQLAKTKNKIIELKNNYYDLTITIAELKLSIKNNKNKIKESKAHICPECKSEIKMNIESYIEASNSTEDFILLSNDLEKDMNTLEKNLKKEEENYSRLLTLLEKYKKKLNSNSTEISNSLKHQGYIELKNSLITDWNKKDEEYIKETKQIEIYIEKIKKYSETKKKINERYTELINIGKIKFNLKEIGEEKDFSNIKNPIRIGGSNAPIGTVLWLTSLLKIKNEFNPTAIKFPLVLDSPNNREFDDEKRMELFEYLFSSVDSETQLIVSTLGFDTEDYKSYSFQNIIKLTNNKYELLNFEDYQSNEDLLIRLSTPR